MSHRDAEDVLRLWQGAIPAISISGRNWHGFGIEHADMFNSYDRLKVYYDNGQAQVKGILEEAFSMFSAKTEFVPEVKPEHYRLFQAADLLCSVELVCVKMNKGAGLSRSEGKFFGSEREFKRDVLKKLRQKAV